MPAAEAQTPTSQPAPASADRSRAAYGAPEPPVMPRKTRTPPLAGGLPAALRGGQERRDLLQLLVVEAAAVLRAEDRHHVVAELTRVGDVLREERGVVGLADLGQVGRAEVRRARARVRVA